MVVDVILSEVGWSFVTLLRHRMDASTSPKRATAAPRIHTHVII